MNRAELERLELVRVADTRPQVLCLLGCRVPPDPWVGLAWDHRDLRTAP